MTQLSCTKNESFSSKTNDYLYLQDGGGLVGLNWNELRYARFGLGLIQMVDGTNRSRKIILKRIFWLGKS